MKTRLFVLFASILIGNAAMAQLGLGIKGGVNITKMDGRDFKDEFNYGYLLGGFAEIGLGGKLSLQPEVLFNQIQSKVDTSLSNIWNPTRSNDDVKLNYLSIPILLDYKLGDAVSLQAGPQFGILMDQNKTLVNNGQEAFKKGNLSMLGGVELSLSKLRIAGRYVVGLNNINDIDNKSDWKSQGFQLSLGLSL